jgi:hypothetical protein
MKKMTGIVCNFLRVQFEDYMTFESDIVVYGFHSVGEMLDQQLDRPEEEVAEDGNIFGCTERAKSGQKVHMPIWC